MKQLFAIYTIIGLLCVPFIYFNNAEGYRPAPSKAYQWGRALGGALYWPSYVFSIEPEVDSESVESFQKSIIDIVAYRNDKLFTGKRSDSHGYMVFTALGNCLALEGADKNHILSLYQELFDGNTKGKEIERIRSAVVEKMDGYDFADIVEAGEECGEDLDKSLASATLSALAEKLTSEPDSNNTRPDNSAQTPDSYATLNPSAKSEPNQYLEEAANQQAPASAEDIPTRFGPLKINDENMLLYKDIPFNPEIQGNNSLSMVGIYQIGNGDVVLIQDNGGTACPAQLYFISISNNSVKATSPFGTCSDLIEARQVADSISVTMPGFMGPFESEVAQKKAAKENHVFIFKGGVLTENGKPVNNELMGDKIDPEPNTMEDAADKAANRSWQDKNGYVHYPDGSVSSSPVD